MLPKTLLLIAAACSAHAEFLRIEVFMKDMDCLSCSASLGKTFEKIRGVKHVEVKSASIALDLADQNHLTIEQIWDAVKRVGFTPADTKVTVRGTVKEGSLQISVIDKTIKIEGQSADAENAELKGTITPPPDPRTPLKLRLE
jgi:copper chaperone CopZ